MNDQKKLIGNIEMLAKQIASPGRVKIQILDCVEQLRKLI